MTEVGYSYCGGCNPRYDRVALIRRLAEECPGITLTHMDRLTGPPAALLTVCGCPAGCAGAPKNLRIPFFNLTDASDYARAKAFLERIRDGGQSTRA